MMESFYPIVEDERHKALKKQVKEICEKLSARSIDLPGYYSLPNGERWFLGKSFNHEALWVRTLPDLYIQPREPPSFFLDVKTKAKPEYKNISIELSSFYWVYRRNMPDSRGVKCLHFYVSPDLEGKIRVFSPLLVKISRIILPLYHWRKGEGRIQWTDEERKLFKHYGECFNPKLIEEKNIQSGSGDPFVLISQDILRRHPILESFIQDHYLRINYGWRKGTVMTDLSKFIGG